MLFRIGINLGDVIHDDSRIYGDGINIAARLEALAEPGGVLVSNTVYDHVRGKLPFTFEDVGERQVKNIEQPVRIVSAPHSRSVLRAPWRRSAGAPLRRIAGVGLGGAWRRSWFSAGRQELGGWARASFQVSEQTALEAPRLSIVVLPFQQPEWRSEPGLLRRRHH